MDSGQIRGEGKIPTWWPFWVTLLDPVFLASWTLLSWLAARTETGQLALDVANLFVPQPAALARAVASLDRSTHERIELGMGASHCLRCPRAHGRLTLPPGRSRHGAERSHRCLQLAREHVRDRTLGGDRGVSEERAVNRFQPATSRSGSLGYWPRMRSMLGKS